MANKWILINAQVQTGTDSQKVKVSADDANSDFLEEKLAEGTGIDLTTQNPGGDEEILIEVDPTEVDHDQLLNYDIDEHRPLNDAATTTTNLWSADKIQTELDNKINRITPVADNRLVKSSGTSGIDVEQTAITVDDSNNVTGINNLVISGDLTVNGTTTSINSTTLEVVDPNITVNKDGTQASAQANTSGFTVEMSDATDARIGYDSTTTSKFKAGEVGSEQEILTTSHVQNVLNKTIDGSTGGSNTVLTTADNTEYDDATSSFTAANVQDAIENLDDRIVTLESEDNTLQQRIQVAKNGNDTTGDGSVSNPYLTIQAAINDITDATTSKRYVIDIAPGRYVENITLKPFVSLNGHTEDTVLIDSTVPMSLSSHGRITIQNLTLAGASGTGGMDIDTTGFAAGTVLTLVNFSVTNANGLTFTGKGSGSDYFEMRDCYMSTPTNLSGASITLYDSVFIGGTVIDSSGTVNDGFGNRVYFSSQNNYFYLLDVQDTQNAKVLTQFLASTLEGTINFTGNVVANSIQLYWDSISYPTSGSTLNFSGQVSENKVTEATSMKYVPANDTHWINPDPTTVQEALDDLADRMTSAETDITALTADVGDLQTLSGVPANSTDYGVFTGSIISDGSTSKEALQELETAQESHATATSGVHGVTGDIVGTTDTQTLTNKTIDAQNNTISNFTVAEFDPAVIDTDLSSVSASDDTLASAKAIKDYVDGVAGSLILSGTATGANNQTTLADVTGLNFAGSERSFILQMAVEIDATADLYAMYELSAVRTDANWILTQNYTGQITNISFDITAGGQVQYVSDNYAGFTSLTFKWKFYTVQ